MRLKLDALSLALAGALVPRAGVLGRKEDAEAARLIHHHGYFVPDTRTWKSVITKHLTAASSSV